MQVVKMTTCTVLSEKERENVAKPKVKAKLMPSPQRKTLTAPVL